MGRDLDSMKTNIIISLRCGHNVSVSKWNNYLGAGGVKQGRKDVRGMMGLHSM